MIKSHLNIALNLGMTEAQLQHLLAIIEANTGKKEADTGRKVLLELIASMKK